MEARQKDNWKQGFVVAASAKLSLTMCAAIHRN
jgi:hypothetical protein